jgi:hypothetical protein
LYFFEIETCKAVDVETVQHLLDAIREMIQSGSSEHGGTAAWRDAEAYFGKIKLDIKNKRKIQNETTGGSSVGENAERSIGGDESSRSSSSGSSQFASERYRRLNL